MRKRIVQFSGTLIAYCAVMQGVFAAGLSDLLARWETLGKHVDRQEVVSLAEVVRNSPERRDSELVPRLVVIVQNASQSLVSRDYALQVACEVADDRGGRLLLNMMSVYVKELRRQYDDAVARTSDQDPENPIRSNALLLETFIENGARHLIEVMDDQQAFLVFLQSCYEHRRLLGNSRRECARLMTRCKVPVANLQRAVLELLEKRAEKRIVNGRLTKAPPMDEVLLDILDPTMFPALRHMIRSGDTPTTFNYVAADALSYLGDTEIIADLEARRPAFRKSQHQEDFLLKCIWRIEVQHPPEKLLEYIASTTPRTYQEMRMWAVRRAKILGIDPTRIRAAILQHCSNAKTHVERSELEYLKWIGVELAILKVDDLPDVIVKDRGYTP